MDTGNDDDYGSDVLLPNQDRFTSSGRKLKNRAARRELALHSRSSGRRSACTGIRACVR